MTTKRRSNTGAPPGFEPLEERSLLSGLDLSSAVVPIPLPDLWGSARMSPADHFGVRGPFTVTTAGPADLPIDHVGPVAPLAIEVPGSANQVQDPRSLASSANEVQGPASTALPGPSDGTVQDHGPPMFKAMELLVLSADVQGPSSISAMTSPGALVDASGFSGDVPGAGAGTGSTATPGLMDASAHFHGPPMMRAMEVLGFSPDGQSPSPVSAMASPAAPGDATDPAASIDTQGSPSPGGPMAAFAFAGGEDRGLHDPRLVTPSPGAQPLFAVPDPSALVASASRLRSRGDPTTAAMPDQASTPAVASAPVPSMSYDVAALSSLSATVQALPAGRAPGPLSSELAVVRAAAGPETNAAGNRSSAGTPRRDEIGTDVATNNQNEIPIASQAERSAPVNEALPQPRGAGLIAEIVALDGAAVEATVARLLERFNELGNPVEAPTAGLPSPALIAAAIVSIEFSRRWLARRKRGVTITVRRQEGLALHGFS